MLSKLFGDMNFDYMDELSLSGCPFFFMIDFDIEQIVVLPKREALEKGIMFEFKDNKQVSLHEVEPKKLELLSHPEDLESFKKGFDIVQNNLQLGNSYLANYTCKTPVDTNYNLEDFFYQSKAKYKVYYQDHFVSFSPETFVEIKGNKIFTYPMKGTIDASLPNAARALRENPKEKAEHYTVVDLLRNDLSQVADLVEVDEFQRIDYLRTSQKDLLAMSSQISGVIKPQFIGKIGSIFRELLPAGSILGAPKVKTKEIISKAERNKRGWYTGVAGWFDGQNLDSCVLIRFIEKNKDQYFFRSGGGITHQSKLEEEYQEMIQKIYVPIH